MYVHHSATISGEHLVSTLSLVHDGSDCCYTGCPANETSEEGLTPQKIAKAEGFKDAMKELKKLTLFQDKAARGAKPKGFAEPWCVKVHVHCASFCKHNNTLKRLRSKLRKF